MDVRVAGADGAGAASSAAVAHASTSVSNVKQPMAINAFFKRVTFAVALQLYPGFVRVRFACTWLKGVQILAKRPLRLGGYKGING